MNKHVRRLFYGAWIVPLAVIIISIPVGVQKLALYYGLSKGDALLCAFLVIVTPVALVGIYAVGLSIDTIKGN